MRRAGAVALVIIAAIIIGAFACLVPIKLFAVAVAGLLYIAVCVVNLKYGLYLTILVRSSLDVLSNYAFQMPLVGTVNIAALMGVWIILLTVFGLVTGTIRIHSPLTPVFLVFLAVSAFSSVTNGAFGAGFEKWLKFASLACVYLLIYNYAKYDRRNITVFLDLTLASSVIPLAAGALQFVSGTGNHMTVGLNRLNATFVHPNPFAFYLLIIIAACFISLYKRGSSSGSRIIVFRLIILVSALIELVFTYTRGAWIGLALMAGIVFVRIDDKRKFYFLIPLFLCALPFAALVLARFKGVLSSNMEDSSLATRLYIWKNMFYIALQSPIIGHGLGTFETYAQSAVNWHIEAHNEYLRTFFETGFVGLVSYVLLFLSALFHINNHGVKSQNAIHITVFSLFFCVCGYELC